MVQGADFTEIEVDFIINVGTEEMTGKITVNENEFEIAALKEFLSF